MPVTKDEYMEKFLGYMWVRSILYGFGNLYDRIYG